MQRDISILPCGIVEKVESWAASSQDITQELKLAGVPPGRYVVYNPVWVREVIGTEIRRFLSLAMSPGILLEGIFSKGKRLLATKESLRPISSAGVLRREWVASGHRLRALYRVFAQVQGTASILRRSSLLRSLNKDLRGAAGVSFQCAALPRMGSRLGVPRRL